MDLEAYANIDDLSAVAKDNGIDVPRLRGYRLMVNQKSLSAEDIKRIKQDMKCFVYHDGCTSIPRFTPQSPISDFSSVSDWYKKKYLTPEGDLRWDLLHGKRRKNMKFAVKKMMKTVERELETWNKYVGREDVLYIHARIGGENWNYYGGYLLEKEPWFLEKTDNSFDNSYCSIYAKIKTKETV